MRMRMRKPSPSQFYTKRIYSFFFFFTSSFFAIIMVGHSTPVTKMIQVLELSSDSDFRFPLNCCGSPSSPLRLRLGDERQILWWVSPTSHHPHTVTVEPCFLHSRCRLGTKQFRPRDALRTPALPSRRLLAIKPLTSSSCPARLASKLRSTLAITQSTSIPSQTDSNLAARKLYGQSYAEHPLRVGYRRRRAPPRAGRSPSSGIYRR
jgi:hypothetical protein